ncbi:MAG: FtsX-like permease family protein [Spirosomataceae bacterium]
MFKNYFKIAFRNLWKNRTYAAINVLGLMVAFCVSSLLFLTAYFQWTFDSFHENVQHIYQVYFYDQEEGKVDRLAMTPLPLASAMKFELGGIQAVSRVSSGKTSVITAENKSLEKMVSYVDVEFLTTFTFPLKNGSAATALSGLQSIVISKSLADALFGTQNPVGKKISVGKIGSEINYLISAVMEDCPMNSSLKFDALCRIESMPNYQDSKTDWSNNAHNLYVMLSDKNKATDIEQRLEVFAKKYFPAKFEKHKPNNVFAIKLQPLSKVHIDSGISGSKGVPIAIIYAIVALGVFILLIACFNFVNLSIAKHFKRAQEMGVRKTLGALKQHLFLQLWGEAIVICVVGFVCGLTLILLLLPVFNAQFDGKIDSSFLFKLDFMAIMGFVLLIVTMLAGGYPAYKMSRLNLVEVLKGNLSDNKPGVLRNSLIVTQFAISSLLICITLIANQQMDFLRQKPVGFNKEQVISIPIGSQLSGRQLFERIKNEFGNDRAVLSIAGSNINVGKGKDRVTVRTTVAFDFKGNHVAADWVQVDGNFVETLGLQLVEGQKQEGNIGNDAIWVSESMKKTIGKGEVLNISLGDQPGTNQIAGVFKDFDLYAPTAKKLPVVLQVSKNIELNYIFLKVRPESLIGFVDKLKDFWHKNAQGFEYMGSFLDENVEGWYQEENTLTQIFTIASGIAIFLSCLGLFAVSLLVIEMRTKEIGIRKVMGASIQNIVAMLCVYFLKFIFLAFLVALPLAWVAMENWLQSYSYRITLKAYPFVIVMIAISGLALFTVSYHALKAALLNPIKTLKKD